MGEYVPVSSHLSMRAMRVSHGTCLQAPGGVYESSAFFIRNDITSREFLFFGDVEPDTVSAKPRTRNVWRVAAKKILALQLDTIFLECSWRNGRPQDLLFGHLSPVHVLEELNALATEIILAQTSPPAHSRPLSSTLSFLGFRVLPSAPSTVSREQLEGVLKGLTLVITHCKEVSDPLPAGQRINHIITQEVKELVDPARLGISVIAADQGMRLCEFTYYPTLGFYHWLKGYTSDRYLVKVFLLDLMIPIPYRCFSIYNTLYQRLSLLIIFWKIAILLHSAYFGGGVTIANWNSFEKTSSCWHAGE